MDEHCWQQIYGNRLLCTLGWTYMHNMQNLSLFHPVSFFIWRKSCYLSHVCICMYLYNIHVIHVALKHSVKFQKEQILLNTTRKNMRKLAHKSSNKPTKPTMVVILNNNVLIRCINLYKVEKQLKMVTYYLWYLGIFAVGVWISVPLKRKIKNSNI